MQTPMTTGDSATLEFTVTDDDTALSLGSGNLEVLATPRLLAWCEAATCSAVEGALADEQTSVGTRVQLEHVGASAVGRLGPGDRERGVRRRAAAALRGGRRAGSPTARSSRTAR